jgi:hypothetical protein
MLILQPILVTGVIVGFLDLVAASALARSRGVTFQRTFQGVASGALGPSSFEGGNKTAALGVLIHFFIATTVTAVYFLASRAIPALLAHPAIFGVLFGAGLHLFMTFVTIPLSRVPKRSFSATFFLAQLFIHMFIIGMPVALLLKRFS